jgi:hypothetical protein
VTETALTVQILDPLWGRRGACVAGRRIAPGEGGTQTRGRSLGGAEAGRAEVDLAHGGTGAATNIAAGLFWGSLFGAHLHRSRAKPAEILRDGVVLGAVAGLLDYGLLPRRLSPGWELALSGRSVVLSMAAMAGAAVVGGLAARATDPEIEDA